MTDYFQKTGKKHDKTASPKLALQGEPCKPCLQNSCNAPVNSIENTVFYETFNRAGTTFFTLVFIFIDTLNWCSRTTFAMRRIISRSEGENFPALHILIVAFIRYVIESL